LQERPALQGEFTLAEIFETHEMGLRRYARYLTGDSDWSEDLVSETMLKAMPHFAALSQMNAFQCKTWLSKVLRNQFLDDLRAHKRLQNLMEHLAEVERISEPSDFLAHLNATIPDHHRKILQMRYGLDMTSEEIGKKMGIPAATARSRLRLAIQWVKNHQDQGD
jgi:RNA polymerase sigma-70 factor, ECF subfamily